eukprot:15466983-Alexandrium_andersonii.AAC.1
MTRWQSLVRTVSGAHRWIRSALAPQWAVVDDNGVTHAGRGPAVAALASWWGALFRQEGRRN